MKQKLKLLSILILIALSGCQEENTYQQNQPNRLTVKSITYSNAKEVKLLDNTLTKMFDGIKSHKNNNKSTTPVEDNDFTIDQTAEVKVMSDGNSTTYTILIKRAVADPQYFENLVVKIDNDSQPKAYIFKYIPSEESHYIWAHKEFSFKGSFEVHEIIYNSSVFQPLVNLSGCGKIALCDYGGTTHNAGDNCTDVYYVLGNCDANTPDGGGGGYLPYTAPVGSGGGAALQGNVLKMNGFITTMSFPKQELFGLLGTSTQDAIFNYLIANNFLNGSTGKVSNFLQLMITNHADSYILGDISATTINPNVESNTNNIFNYLMQNNFSTQSVNFAVWAFNYLSQNPDVTSEQFQNWFMGTSEGQDGTYDATFWENPNLTFPQQALPTLVNFMNAYPKRADGVTFMTGAELFPLVGGAVYQAYLDNSKLVRGACALKVSRALNYSGITIPNTTNTLLGADGKYYFVNAMALNKWMRKTFGTNPATSDTPFNANHHHFTASQGGAHGENFPTLLAGIKGIYSMVAPVAIRTSWASGHADLIYNSTCAAATNCYFYDPKNSFVPIDYIDVWELP